MRRNKPFGEIQCKIFQFYLLEIKKLRTSLTASKRIIDKDRNTKTTERINNNSLSCSVTDKFAISLLCKFKKCTTRKYQDMKQLTKTHYFPHLYFSDYYCNNSASLL